MRFTLCARPSEAGGTLSGRLAHAEWRERRSSTSRSAPCRRHTFDSRVRAYAPLLSLPRHRRGRSWQDDAWTRPTILTRTHECWCDRIRQCVAVSRMNTRVARRRRPETFVARTSSVVCESQALRRAPGGAASRAGVAWRLQCGGHHQHHRGRPLGRDRSPVET